MVTGYFEQRLYHFINQFSDTIIVGLCCRAGRIQTSIIDVGGDAMVSAMRKSIMKVRGQSYPQWVAKSKVPKAGGILIIRRQFLYRIYPR